MSAGMAGVIAAHREHEVKLDHDSYLSVCTGCHWRKRHSGDSGHAAHLAEELAKAGYGNVQEAKVEALREVHEVLLAEIDRAPESNLGSSADYALGWERGLEHADGQLGLAAALADSEGHALVKAIHDRKAGA